MLDDPLDFVAIRRFAVLAVALSCLGVAPALAQQAVDEELLSLTGSQPALAADVHGGFVTIWTDTEAKNEGLGIRGCLLAPKDGSCGPHFAVNTTAVGDQMRPAVAADDPGRFVVAWQGPAESGTGIYGQRFGAGAVKLGPELVLSRARPGIFENPTVSMGEGGDFVAAWQDSQANRIEAARFSAQGKPHGSPLPMDAKGETNSGARVVRYPGGFAVTWYEFFEQSGGRSGYSSAAVATFDSAGRPLGVERIDGTAIDPLIGGRGGALAIFPSLDGYAAQRFEASGELKKQFPVAGPPRGCIDSDSPCETLAAAAMDSRGRFVVIWEVTEHGTISNLFAQLFTPGGKARTRRVPVNTVPSMGFETPAVALTDDGSVLVAWTRYDTEHPDQSGLYLRRMRLE